MSQFNPHETEEIERLARRLEDMASAVRDWHEGDIEVTGENPLEHGPIAVNLIQARMVATEDLITNLGDAAANIRATHKLTGLLNEWSNWWSEQ